jgi:multisubunit Na+/H+ antiporter MnhF subunit
MTDLNPAAAHHLPFFITPPGATDVLLVIMAVVLIGAVLATGVFFFWLHSLPERMVHNKIQFDVVAVLALLSLFTHQHVFWVAALLIALIDFPNFSMPEFSGSLGRIANSLEAIAANPAEADPTTSKSLAHSAGRRTDTEALPINAQTDQLESASANGRPEKQGR